MKRIFTTILSFLFLAPVFGQGSDDACLFSQTYYQGTAKGLGMGNALGAVGGDMTSVSINPAGMGIYRSNELTMTLGLMDNYHASNYYDNTTHGNKMRLSIPNLGYVKTKQRSNYRPLRYTQFGIILNRLNDFNIHTLAKGLNPTSSRTNNSTFFDQINGIHPDYLPNDVWPLWKTFLIDDHLDSDGYYHYTSNVPNNVMQGQETEFKGRSEEWTLAFSANYFDKLFIGANLGIQYLKRTGWRAFEESMPENMSAISGFSQWSYTEDFNSTALGFNGKIGLIWFASPWYRIGAAFHTPSLYHFNETWQNQTESQINWITNKYISPESNYEYLFVKPLKCVGSAAFIIGQSGIVSIDIEYTDYGTAQFKAIGDDDYDYTPTNNEIKEVYGPTFNFRLGSEWRLDNSYLRFGAGYYGSPFGLGYSGGRVKKASVGLSLPAGDYTTFDFAYELTHGKSYIYLYDYEPLQSIDQSQFKSLVMVTMRIRL